LMILLLVTLSDVSKILTGYSLYVQIILHFNILQLYRFYLNFTCTFLQLWYMEYIMNTWQQCRQLQLVIYFSFLFQYIEGTYESRWQLSSDIKPP
jgi:hypothetical protein